jgi:hypothetical protein
MDLTFRKAQLRKKTLDRRAFPRTSVLWSALIATSNGRSAFDCIIRNINAGGAEISSKKALELDEKVHLLVTRTHVAYLASVAWIKGERMGLSFGQSWDVARGLPAELGFLRQRLAEAKLSQMLELVKHGMLLEEAAGTVGWTKDELEQVGDMLSADRSASLALMQTKELLKK